MKFHIGISAVALAFVTAAVAAQEPRQASDTDITVTNLLTGMPDTPAVLTADGQRCRVVPIKGLERPWALAILPDGDVLVTERVGRLRIIRNGVLDPSPITGLPKVNTGAVNSGLMDILLHPSS